jgi:DNA repair photolyase
MDFPQPKGRGSQSNPPNRFGIPYHEAQLEQVEHDVEYLAGLQNIRTEYIPDHSRSIIAENDSPDVGFRYSINPYRGCSHGCAYCYARPTHEFFELGAGLDFETKIFVKQKAPDLFREFLQRDGWQPKPIALSGVTDCYQPAERQYQLTRACLEVAAEARQPMVIISKNALVLRDLDILKPMAKASLIRVLLSVTSLDADLARSMEPRTSIPAARLRAMKELADASVPVGALVAPIIPGLNDHEIPAILAAVKKAGGLSASHIFLRLPLSVAPVFLEWLQRARPTAFHRVESRIRAMREGKLNNSKFGERMRGKGEMAEKITQVFELFAKRYGLDGEFPPLDCTQFRAPRSSSGQLRLF